MGQKLSIYLVKDGYNKDSEFINIDRASKPKKLILTEGEGTLFIKKKAIEKYPEWVSFITNEQKEVKPILFSKTKSSGAIIKLSISNRIFLISFGTGFHLINNICIEKGFGLKVTINSVDPDYLRSIDKSNYEDNPLNTRNQSTKEVNIKGFNFDRDMDLLSSLTGKSNEPLFGNIVTGKDSLVMSPDSTLTDISKIIKKALKYYNEKISSDFEWIENIKRCDRDGISKKLDGELNKILSNVEGSSELWLGEPEIVDWEKQIGYSFNPRKNEIYQVLTIDRLYDFYNKNGIPTTVEKFKNQYISILDDQEKVFKKWTVYDCIYAEINYENNTYILRAGDWYLIEGNFIKDVDNFLSKLKHYEFNFPIYKHDREEDYNKHVSTLNSKYINMDQKNIQQGGKHDKVEFCDLLHEKDFIHVKFYRSSSTLSHLFSQGYVSAESFLSNQDFREKLLKMLPGQFNANARPNSADYKVVFAIATTKDIPKNLPFFSKLTLKNIVKSLEVFGYNVRIAKIDICDDFLTQRKEKSKKKSKAQSPKPKAQNQK